MKVLVIPMCTLLGLASVNAVHNSLTPIEKYHVQEYLSEPEKSITPEFVKDIFEFQNTHLGIPTCAKHTFEKNKYVFSSKKHICVSKNIFVFFKSVNLLFST